MAKESLRKQIEKAARMYNDAKMGYDLDAVMIRRPEERGSRRGRALYKAAEDGEPKLVETLLGRGASPNFAYFQGFTPLFCASIKGYGEIVIALLRAGALVNMANKDKLTPLFCAAQHGKDDIVDILLGAGADVNRSSPLGGTPLYIASIKGHECVVRKLLAAGADTATKFHGKTARQFAIEKGFPGVAEIIAAKEDLERERWGVTRSNWVEAVERAGIRRGLLAKARLGAAVLHDELPKAKKPRSL